MKKKKNKNHDYQKQEQQTNKMLDAMYWSEKKQMKSSLCDTALIPP